MERSQLSGLTVRQCAVGLFHGIVEVAGDGAGLPTTGIFWRLRGRTREIVFRQ